MTELTILQGGADDGQVMDSSTGERIEEMRAVAKLSKNKLNERCGFSSGYISRLTTAKEVRENPRPITLEIVAAALEASFDYLARGALPKAGPKAPTNWGFTRREVAMRVLLARGAPAADIEQASARLRGRYGEGPDDPEPMATMTIQSWLRELQEEVASPTPTEEIARFAVRHHGAAPNRYADEREVVQAVSDELRISLEEARSLVGRVAFSSDYMGKNGFDLFRAVMRAAKGAAGGVAPFAAHPSVPTKDADALRNEVEQGQGQGAAEPPQRASPSRKQS